MENHRAAYLRLSKDREQLLKAAREARALCTRAYVDCAAGRGPGATDAQIDEAERLEARLDAIDAEMHAHVRAALGFN